MGKHKHFKVKGFLNCWLVAEIHAVPKIREKWISMVWEKYGKHKHLKFMDFLNISGEAEIHTIPKIREK